MTAERAEAKERIEGADHVAGDRHHQWPAVPHGLRGRPGGSPERLAQDLDQRIEKLRGNFGEIGDARLTIMAALTVADELADVNNRLKRVETELASLQDARITSAEHAKATQAAISAALNAAAERIEGLTRQLNQTAAKAAIAMG